MPETQTVRQTKHFYNSDMVVALSDCVSPKQDGGAYEAQPMPVIIRERLNTSDYSAPIWMEFFTSTSLVATGRSKSGNGVVVYAHIPHELSTPDGIQAAKGKNYENLVNGAGILSQTEFNRLLGLEDGKTVFVVDYNDLKASKSGRIPVSEALSHPQIIPFLGVERDEAEAYLKEHSKAYRTDRIGVWHSDDLGDEPVGRLLVVLNGDYDNGGLDGSDDLGSLARFFGVRNVSTATGGAKSQDVPQEIIKTPSLEEVINVAKGRFVPESAMREFEAEMRKLYK